MESSRLAAGQPAVWDRIASFEGINHELGPLMRMTAPRHLSLEPDSVPLGKPWFRSWVLLFGVIPFDYDHLCIVELEVGSRFLERSTMLSAKVWEHERTLDALPGGGTRVTDRVAFEPRIRPIGGLHERVIRATFRHRHRRLRAFFGAA